jgi:hypothetical protein
MPQYLCLVTVLTTIDQPPSPPLQPSHPIMLPGMPGWGGGGPVDPGYSPPWAQVPPGGQGGGPVDPGYSPPWARPKPPVAGWPGGLPGGGGFPGQGGPVDPGYSPPWARPQPPRPDNSLPPFPSHPIYIPPEGSQPPLGIWGPTDPRPGYGLPGPQPHPEHPIVLPPDLPPETPEGGKIEWKTAWTPQTGWIVIGIPAEGTLVPTPS